jgi:hypothetical protein
MNSTEHPAKPRLNRRSSVRFGLSNLARLECRKGAFGFGPNLLVRTLDISETGVRVVVKAALETGNPVEIVVSGTGMSRPQKRVAKVVWVLRLDDGNCCAGLHFDRPLAFRDVLRVAKPLR